MTLAVEALSAVSGSIPRAMRTSAPASASPTKNSTNSPMVPLSEAGTARGPTRTRISVCGCATARTASGVLRSRITQRRILMEPAVEPTQPPQNMSSSRNIREKSDQASKSSVANPEVVMIATAWKAAWRSPSQVSSPARSRPTKNTPVARSATPR